MKLIRFSIIALATTGFLFTSCKKESNPPAPIVVNAGTSQSILLPIDSVTLTGTLISGQSSSLIYAWTLITGPNKPVILNSDSTTATVSALIAGTYIFQFAATNNAGTVIGEDTVSVSVEAVTKTDSIPGLWIGTYTVPLTSFLDPGVSFYFSFSIYPDGTLTYESKGDDNGNLNYITYASGTWSLTGNIFSFSAVPINDYQGLHETQTGTATYNSSDQTLTNGTISAKDYGSATWSMTKTN